LLKESTQSRTVTVEEIEDEDDVSTVPKKKKKKPKKRKKKSTATEPRLPTEKPVQADDKSIQVDDKPQAAPLSVSPTPAPVAISKTTGEAPATSPSKTKPQVKPPKLVLQSASTATSPVIPPHMSTTSLNLAHQTAQSAHSYLQSESLAEAKNKVKSRPGHGNLTTVSEKRGWFSKFSKKEEENRVEEEEKKSMGKWFSQMTKKAKSGMHQLLGTTDDDKKGMAPMKWEQFLRVSPLDQCPGKRRLDIWHAR
jgi:hypothetical protein